MTIVMVCPEHAPSGMRPMPYDDGRPSCGVCGVSNYAVKPYDIKPHGSDLYWRLDTGVVVRPKGGGSA